MATGTSTDYATLRTIVKQVANTMVSKGPGFAQESVVLRAAFDELAAPDLETQQMLLTCWHDLFREGVLAWGYDVDNPGAPFFHFSRRDPSAR